MMKSCLPYVPEVLWMEILSRLPHASSVIGLSTVCKSWNSLIKSPEFISKFNQHHHHQHNHYSNQPYSDPSVSYPYTLLFKFQRPDYGSVYDPDHIVHHNIDPIHDILLHTSHRLCPPPFQGLLPCPSPRLSFVRASSGDLLLLCYLTETYSTTKHHLVCNPLTRECFTIPFIESSCEVTSKKYPFGLASDRRTGLYRVVSPQNLTWGPFYEGWNFMLAVFSPEVGEWRTASCAIPSLYIPSFSLSEPFYDDLCDDAVDSGNGVLYFPVRHKGRIAAVAAIDPFRYDDPAKFRECGHVWRVIHMPAAYSQQPADLKMVKFGAVRGRLRVACWAQILGGHLRVGIWELRYNGGGERDDHATTQWVLVQDFRIEAEKEDMYKMTFVAGLHPNNGDIVFVVRGSDICRYEIKRGKCEKIGAIPKIGGGDYIKDNLPLFLNVFTLLHSNSSV